MISRIHNAIFSNSQLKYEYMKKVNKGQYLIVTGEIRGAEGAWRKGERPKGAPGLRTAALKAEGKGKERWGMRERCRGQRAEHRGQRGPCQSGFL